MQNKKNVMTEPSGVDRRQTISLLILAAVVLLAVGGFLLYRNHNTNTSSHKTYKSIAQANAAVAQQELASKDYESYQTRLSVEANDYIAKGDFSDAEKTLATITKNIPQDKITSQTYRAYWSLYQQKGDTQNRKKYALLTAQKLRAEGQAAAAADFEKDGSGS